MKWNPKRPAPDRLGRLYRMAGFYPRRHLTLVDALRATVAAFRERAMPLEFRIEPGRYVAPELGPGREGPHAAALRRQLAAHGTERVRFAAETTADQLWRFLSAVALPPNVAAVAGGLAGALRAAEVVSVTVDGSEPVPTSESAQIESATEEFTVPAGSGVAGGVQRGGYYEMFARPDAAARAVLEEVESARRDLGATDPTDVAAYRAQLRRLVAAARQFENLRQPGEVLGVLKFLAQTARSATGEAREAVFAAVRSIARGRTVADVVGRLSDGAQDARERAVVTRILVMIGQEAATAAAEALERAEDLAVRRALLDTLVALDRVGVPAVDALPTDGPWYVVRNRVAILGEARDALALDEFARAMQHHDVRVRKETARALAKIEGEEAVDFVIRALSDADPDVRAAAAVTLGVRDEYYAFHALLHHLEAETNEEVLTEVMRALGRHGNPSAVPALAQVARDGKKPVLRIEAVRALGAIGRSALPALREFESDRNAEVRQAVAEAVRAAARRS